MATTDSKYDLAAGGAVESGCDITTTVDSESNAMVGGSSSSVPLVVSSYTPQIPTNRNRGRTSSRSAYILNKAKTDWLTTKEVIFLLTPSTTPLTVCRAIPPSPPPSGSLLMYNRKEVLHYRNDGYEWKRKRTNGMLREDQVLLQDEGRYRVSGGYAKCETHQSLNRRTYHLLLTKKVESSNDPGSTREGGSSGGFAVGGNAKLEREGNLVLMHYLDKKAAKEEKQRMAAEAKAQKKKKANKRLSLSSSRSLDAIRRPCNAGLMPMCPNDEKKDETEPSRITALAIEAVRHVSAIHSQGDARLKMPRCHHSEDSVLTQKAGQIPVVAARRTTSTATRVSRPDVPPPETFRRSHSSFVDEDAPTESELCFDTLDASVRADGWSGSHREGNGLESSTSLLMPSELLPEILGIRPNQVPVRRNQGQHDGRKQLGSRTIVLSLSGPIPTSATTAHPSREVFSAFVQFVQEVKTVVGGEQNGCETDTARLRVRRVELSASPVHVFSGENGHKWLCQLHPPDAITHEGRWTIVLVGLPPSSGERDEMVLWVYSELIAKELQAKCDEVALLDSSSHKAVSSPLFDVTHRDAVTNTTGVSRPTFFACSGTNCTEEESSSVQILSQLSRTCLDFVADADRNLATTTSDIHLTRPWSKSTAAQVQTRMDFQHNQLAAPRDQAQQTLSSASLPLDRVLPLVCAHNFFELDEKSERASTSFEEISSALRDIHGDARQCASAPTMLPVKRHDHNVLFDAALVHVPLERKHALHLAMTRCPEIVWELNHHFLRNFTPPLVAAERCCRYWDVRYEIFGEVKAFLPMTLDGAMLDDLATLSERYFGCYLPDAEDKFGRGVIYFSDKIGRNMFDVLSLTRKVWYMHHVAMEKMKDPSAGVVHIMDMHWMIAEHVDVGVAAKLHAIFGVLPIPVRATHFLNVPWFFKRLHPLIRRIMDPQLRQREIIHHGNTEEMLRSLASFGIHRAIVPTVSGGDFDLNGVDWPPGHRANGHNARSIDLP